jgi:TBC domain-containing protein kinase-like protein
MCQFITNFCQGFFAKDNSKLMREYVLAFRFLLSYHDPLLATHLQKIGLSPELYVISWFMTFYARIYPVLNVYRYISHR